MTQKRSPTGAPYLRNRETAAKRNWLKAAALFPLLSAGLFFYGIPALLMTGVSVIAALLTEVLMRFLLKTKTSPANGDAFLIGLTLALWLPAGLPVWMAALGSCLAVALGRDAFGGPGQYPLSPVVTAYLFLWVSFPLSMCHVLEPGTFEASAFPLVWMKENPSSPLPEFSALVFAPVSGAAGTAFFPAVLAGGLILLYKRLILWEMPCLFLAAAALTAFAFGENPAAVLVLGSSVFAAFFLVPDGVSAPHHRHGIRFFALLTGFLSVALRQITFAFDPVAAALLLVSFLAPWLDESGRPQIRKADIPGGACAK